MMILDGQATKNLNLYPPTKPNMDLRNPWWDEFEPELGLSLPLLALGKAHISRMRHKMISLLALLVTHFLSLILKIKRMNEVDDVKFEQMRTILHTDSSLVETKGGMYYNINPNMTIKQNKLLLQLLQKY